MRGLSLACLLLIVALPIAHAAALPVTYHQDLGTAQAEGGRIQISISVDASVNWSLDGGAVAAGATITRPLSPAPQAMVFHVVYDLQRPCCPNQRVTGSQDVPATTSIGTAVLPPFPISGDQTWNLQLTITGSLHATPKTPGASVQPVTMQWTTWDPQSLSISPDAPAPPAVALSVMTRYDISVTPTVSHTSGFTATASPLAAKIDGQPDVTASYIVAGAKSAPLPLPMIAIAAAALARRRWMLAG